MTPQEMFFKLKGYMGHNLPCEFHHHKRVEHKTLEEYPLNYGLLNLGIKKIVPKLRKPESMTDEEINKVLKMMSINSDHPKQSVLTELLEYDLCSYRVIEYLCFIHVDVFGILKEIKEQENETIL